MRTIEKVRKTKKMSEIQRLEIQQFNQFYELRGREGSKEQDQTRERHAASSFPPLRVVERYL